MIALIAPCQIVLVEPCPLGTSAHNRGIVTPRPVGQRRQSGADKDDQDDEQDSAHNQLFKRRSINRWERCEVP